jgi:hypothetical protein
MLVPTNGTKIHEHPLATLWFDEKGILHKISKKCREPYKAFLTCTRL